MNDDLAAARTAFEECVEAYVAERRASLQSFARAEFSVRSTLIRVQRTARKDLLRHPVNLLCAVVALTTRKAASLADKLGFDWLARLLFRVPLPLSTDYQVEVQAAVVGRWLGLVDEANPLRALFAADPRIIQASAKYPELTTRLAGTDRLKQKLRGPLISYVENRTTLLDLAASSVSLGAASWVFGDSGLSPAQMVNRLAGRHANEQAASHFFLGKSAGKVFHNLFPVEPTSWEIVLSSLVIFMGLSAMTIAVVLLTDPLLLRLRSSEQQLLKLLEAFSQKLLLDVRGELALIESGAAQPLAVKSRTDRVLEQASHLAELTTDTLGRTSRAMWQAAQPRVQEGLALAQSSSLRLWRWFMRLPLRVRLVTCSVLALFIASSFMVRHEGKGARAAKSSHRR